MKVFLNNFLRIFNKKSSFFLLILGVLIIWYPSYYFTESLQIIGNLGETFYYTEITLSIAISILFWLFLASSFHKFRYFGAKNTWIWWIGAFLWVIVSWCPACSITLASYIWLASIISILPFYWLELKFLSVFMLIYANYSIIKNLEVCKVRIK